MRTGLALASRGWVDLSFEERRGGWGGTMRGGRWGRFEGGEVQARIGDRLSLAAATLENTSTWGPGGG